MTAPGAVHILRHGLALCGFGEGQPPGEWPPGQQWVGTDTSSEATCQYCKAKLEAQGGSAVVEAMAGPSQIKRFAVFSVRKDKHGVVVWVRAGNAVSNRDGSINVHLDVLPLDGQLHLKAPDKEPR